ncbi:MAG: tetratricopeptide repeat protein [Planctomycetota bacterium]
MSRKLWRTTDGVIEWRSVTPMALPPTRAIRLAALDRKDWPRAEPLARETLPLSEKVGSQKLIASNCRFLAHALVRQGQAAEALPYARRAVEIFTKLGSPDLAAAQATLRQCEG